DQADDEVSLRITSTGYDVFGANSTSGTGTITKLVVTDAGTAKTSSFELTEASQNLTGGLTIGSNVADADISSEVKTAGGNVTIDSPNLTLAANISSGSGSQTYGGAVVLGSDVTLLTGDGGANVAVRVEFQGTVDSDTSARTLNVRSEAIYARAAIGGTSELASYLGETLGDVAEGGQSYRSVTTIGTQNYQAETSSGDVEFNGTYTSDGDINLLGEGSYGVYLSLVGDTAIDVGAGSFNVVRAGGKGGSIFSDGGPFNLSIDAARVDAPIGIGVDPTGNFATPQINVLTFSSGATTKVNAPELVAAGGIQATGAVVPLVNIELLSESGAINLAGGLDNLSMAVTLGDANQTGDIFVGKRIQALQLDIGA
ncbi:MAG: hypothetical protein EBY57_12210, partial [Actinobacteria bacterium]|nr:hypothetical protein [Actinomycetota bacterium]